MDESFIVYNLPLGDAQIRRIQNVLSENDVLVTSGTNAEMPYNVVDYLHPSISVHAYVDRNLLSYAIALQESPPTDRSWAEFRIAAACMCFLNLVDAQIEPNVALYELGNKNAHHVAYAEYQKYSVAINVSPVAYAKIAFGKEQQVPAEEIERIRNETADKGLPEEEFKKKLRYQKTSYLCMLKAACLIKDSGAGIDVARKYVDWMTDEFYLHSVELLYVLIGMSSRSPGVLKGFRSSNTSKLGDAITRASWDLLYLRFLQQKATNGDEYQVNMLCTRDAPLRLYAQDVLFAHSSNENADELVDLLQSYWGDPGIELAQYIREKEQVVNDENRCQLVQARRRGIDSNIVACENELGV